MVANLNLRSQLSDELTKTCWTDYSPHSFQPDVRCHSCDECSQAFPALLFHFMHYKPNTKSEVGLETRLVCCAWLAACMDLLLLHVMCREPVVDAASSSNQPLSKTTEESTEESHWNGVLVEVQPQHRLKITASSDCSLECWSTICSALATYCT